MKFFRKVVLLFPELANLIAFRIVDQNNHPLDGEGYLKDDKNSVIAKFKTSFPGLGKFSFIPWNGQHYTAYIETKDGEKFSYSLPKTDDYAADISVVGEDQKALTVQVSLGDSLYDKYTITYLVAITRDSACFASIGQGMYRTVIPKRSFFDGEATLLLFDEYEHILSERDIYINANEPVDNNESRSAKLQSETKGKS